MTNKSDLAIYPGTFDPFTLGHIDILERALRIFDEVEITIAVNKEKSSLFTVDERIEMIEAATRDYEGVSIAHFEGLLVDYAAKRGAKALVRGLRQVSDFDYEFRMAFANRKMSPEIETVMFVTSEAHAFTSASIVREVYRWSGDVSLFVPPAVARLMLKKKTTG